MAVARPSWFDLPSINDSKVNCGFKPEGLRGAGLALTTSEKAGAWFFAGAAVLSEVESSLPCKTGAPPVPMIKSTVTSWSVSNDVAISLILGKKLLLTMSSTNRFGAMICRCQLTWCACKGRIQVLSCCSDNSVSNRDRQRSHNFADNRQCSKNSGKTTWSVRFWSRCSQLKSRRGRVAYSLPGKHFKLTRVSFSI